MANISASVPERLKEWIESQIAAGMYTSTSDYLRDLIRADQSRRQQLDQLLLDGLNSGKPVAADDAYWARKEAALKKRS